MGSPDQSRATPVMGGHMCHPTIGFWVPPSPTTVEAKTVPKVTRLTPPTGVLAGEPAFYLLGHLILSSHPPPRNSWPETRTRGAQCAANESFVIDTSAIPSAPPNEPADESQSTAILLWTLSAFTNK